MVEVVVVVLRGEMFAERSEEETHVPERKRKTMLWRRGSVLTLGVGMRCCLDFLTPAHGESALWHRRRRHCGRF